MENMEELFNFPDPIIEEMYDEEEFQTSKREEIRKEEEYMKNRVARYCNTCNWSGGLLNPNQKLCPKCGFGISKGKRPATLQVEIKKKDKKTTIQHLRTRKNPDEEDIITDME